MRKMIISLLMAALFLAVGCGGGGGSDVDLDLSRMNPNTYEAALDLGATPGQALRMVMLPELWPGMLSGFILALTLSVDDFGVTFFTKGSRGLETLSTFIYSDARKGGLTPELRPLFTIILLVMLTVLIYINIRNSKQEEK